MRTRAKPTKPTSTAFRELHASNFTILRAEVSPSEVHDLYTSALDEEYMSAIGGDKRRKFAVNAAAAPLAARFIERAFEKHHLLHCTDSSLKSVADVAGTSQAGKRKSDVSEMTWLPSIKKSWPKCEHSGKV